MKSTLLFYYRINKYQKDNILNFDFIISVTMVFNENSLKAANTIEGNL